MIREFQVKDKEAVMRLWLDTNLESHSFIPKEYWTGHYDEVSEILPQSEVYVYEEQGQVQGFIGCENGFVAGLFVDKRKQFKGIGTLLLEKVKSIYPKIQLKVYKNNIRAVDFYLRKGFQVIEESIHEDTDQIEYTMEWKEKG